MDWLTSLPPQALLALLVLGVVVMAITLAVAIVQGRELSFWPPRLGPRPGPPRNDAAGGDPGPLPAALQVSGFDGLWENVWGWTSIHTDGRHGRGVMLNRSGTAYFIEGTIESGRFEFDALRYEKRDVVERVVGHLEVKEGGRSLEGSWKDSQGAWIQLVLTRVRWPVHV